MVDTGTYWSPFGQVVILLLIRAEASGSSPSSTLLLLIFFGGRTTLRDRLNVQQSLGGLSLTVR